jgi:PAS domain S-box-containing protein
VWSADRNGRLSPGNDSWCRFTGQSQDACSLLAAVHEDDRPDVAREWWKAIHEREIFIAEFRLHKANGNHCTVLAKAVPVFEANGNVREWVGACTDIDMQRRAEDALRHSERLALAGRMAASIAHEINNPLEGVTNLLYLIRTADDIGAIRSYVDMAQGELRRVVDVVAQTLSYYRQSSRPSEQSLAELVDSVLVLLGGRLRSRNINLEKRYSDAPKVTCYPGEIKQILANLLTNSMDAMQDGGRLIVSVKRVGGADGSAEAVRLTIADNGAGIPDEVKVNLFQPFFSTKGNRGTGLGLWITAALLRKHHSKLKIKSSTAAGACGTIMSMLFPTHLPAEAEEGDGRARRTAARKEPHDISDTPTFLHAAAVQPGDSARSPEAWRNGESSHDEDPPDVEDKPLKRGRAL